MGKKTEDLLQETAEEIASAIGYSSSQAAPAGPHIRVPIVLEVLRRRLGEAVEAGEAYKQRFLEVVQTKNHFEMEHCLLEAKLAKAIASIRRAKVDYELDGDTAGARAMAETLKEVGHGTQEKGPVQDQTVQDGHGQAPGERGDQEEGV